jgi:hypothetical protein
MEPETSRITGRVAFPAGVDPTKLTIGLVPSALSEVENDPNHFPPLASPGPDALFTVETTSPTLELLLEFNGPGVRRARFPWPVVSDARPVFRMQPGATTTLLILDEETRQPIPHALIGPIFPSEEADSNRLDRVFPFFARTNESGEAVVHGLLPETPYWYPVYAPGFERLRDTITSGLAQTITLRRGGSTVTGRLIGARTQQPYPNEVLQVMGERGQLSLQHRTDVDGRFAIDGFPPGVYTFVPYLPRLGDMKGTEVELRQDHRLPGLVVEVSEGIDISGIVSDVETGLPIEGALVTLRNETIKTGRLGAYRFERVRGPWPASATVELPGFEFLPEDQDTIHHPFNGFEGNELVDVPLKLRRIRWLESVLAVDPPEEPLSMPAALEVVGPLPLPERREPPQYERLTEARNLHRLKSAGTRVAVARRPDGKVSELLSVSTAANQTTTTLNLTLAEGARIRGHLLYEEGPPAPWFELALRTTVRAEPVDFLTIRPESDGTFASDALPPGRFVARFLRADGSAWFEEDITLERGGEIVLERMVSRGKPYAGVVVSPEGEPQRGIPLLTYGVDTMGQSLRRMIISDDEGRFRIEGFDTIQEIMIEHHQWKVMFLRDITIPNEDARIVLEPRRGIRVRTALQPSGLRVARAIALVGAQRSDQFVTGQWYYAAESVSYFGGEEAVTLSPAVSARMQIAVEADGRWDVSAPFDWTPDGPPMELDLTPSHRSGLIVTIDGANANDLRALTVTLVNTSLPEERTETAFAPRLQPPNRLAFEALPAGQYLLIATGPNGDTITRTNLFIPSGRTEALSITFAPTLFTIEGTLYESLRRGKPLADAEVVLHHGDMADPPPLDRVRTGRDGRFRFQFVQGGRMMLLESRHGTETARHLTPELRQDIRDIVMAFPERVKVRFRFPERLARRSREAPAVPIIITSLSLGEGLSLTPEQEGQPLDAWAGEFFAFWGEDQLGRLLIPDNGGEVTLPDLPERQ